MTVTLFDACEAANERKLSIVEDGVNNQLLDEANTRLLLMGLDIDMEEYKEAMASLAEHFLNLITFGGAPLINVFPGIWTDGFLTGWMLAHLREKEERQNKLEDQGGEHEV